MNCRAVEVSILPNDPVQPILSEHYVEARLHTDGKTNIERILQLQDELARSPANPIYVIVDPSNERELGRVEGAPLLDSKKREFLEFLEQPLRVAQLDR